MFWEHVCFWKDIVLQVVRMVETPLRHCLLSPALHPGSATGGPRANCGWPVIFCGPSNYSDRSRAFLKRQFLYYNINSWNNTPLMVRLTFYFYFETGNWVSCHWLFWSFLSLHLTTDRSPEEKQCVYSHWMRQYLCAPTMMSHHVWMTDHVDVKFQKRIRNSNYYYLASSCLLWQGNPLVTSSYVCHREVSVGL